MKRIALQLLLAFALILQGSVGAFGTTLASRTHGSCCPHGMLPHHAQVDAQHSHCPCCPDSPCKADCAQFCASCVATTLIVPPAFAAFAARAPAAVLARIDTALRIRSDLPPTRPPIA